jgi:ornithine lipid ester-linked acyl 2-hydroxylase
VYAPGGSAVRFLWTLRLMEWFERLISRFSSVGNPPVFANHHFSWVPDLERAFPEIRLELSNLLASNCPIPPFQEFSEEQRTLTKDSGWKTFMFLGYGAQSLANCSLCPLTWAALQRVDGLQTALFSILEPGKRLPSHRGPFKGVLRGHLGLIIPAQLPYTGIGIDASEFDWIEGKLLIFDDTFYHSAWNLSSGRRVVLFFDFERPLPWPLASLNRLILRLYYSSPNAVATKRKFAAWYREHGIQNDV